MRYRRKTRKKLPKMYFFVLFLDLDREGNITVDLDLILQPFHLPLIIKLPEAELPSKKKSTKMGEKYFNKI